MKGMNDMNDELVQYGLKGKKLDHIPVFNAHAHLGTWTQFEPFTVDHHLELMDRLGIDIAAVSSTLALEGDIMDGNDQIAEMVESYPERFIGYAHVSANYPDLMVSELERCFANPAFRGIKVYQSGIDYDDPAYDPVWDFARLRSAPVLAHIWGDSLTGLDKAAQKHPHVNFLLAHAGSEFKYQAAIDAAAGAHAENLYLDLTYSCEHTNMIEHFVETLGVERIVWGTDSPLFSMPQQLSKVLFARISDADKKKILYDNAAALFGLDLPR